MIPNIREYFYLEMYFTCVHSISYFVRMLVCPCECIIIPSMAGETRDWAILVNMHCSSVGPQNDDGGPTRRDAATYILIDIAKLTYFDQ